MPVINEYLPLMIGDNLPASQTPMKKDSRHISKESNGGK